MKRLWIVVTLAVLFSVMVAGATEANGKLWLNRDVFSSGESIQVSFQAPSNWPSDAWIGIIPSNIPHGDEALNDQHDITYQYIEKRTSGTMTFVAPGPGQWDLRMHDTDSNGREIAYVSFTVKSGGSGASEGSVAKVWLSRNVFSRGESIQVSFQAPSNWPSDAWIGIIPSNIPHGDEALNDQHDIAYQYIERRTSGTMTFVAPGPGQWDFRIHNTDSNGREYGYVSFTVR